MPDIDFNTIPASIENPGTYLEVDSSLAGLGSFTRVTRGLLIGMRLSAGTVAEATVKTLRNAGEAETFFGVGSQLAQMAACWFDIAPDIEVHAVALDEDGGGTAASGTHDVTGTATEDGTLEVIIDDRIKVPVSVSSGDDGDTVAAAIVSAVTASTYDRRIVTPSFLSPTLTWTYRHKGTMGNGHRIKVVTDSIPAGITISAHEVYLSSGATDPDMDTATAALGDTRYTHIGSGLNDTANIGKLCDTFLGSPATNSGRWAYNVKKWGIGFFGITDTQGNTTTAGNDENAASGLMFGLGKAQKPEHCIAADAAAIAAKVYSVDPAKDLKGRRFSGSYVAPLPADIFTWTERNTVLTDGIATVEYDAGGTARVSRAATLYQTNSGGTPDKAFHDLEDVHNLMASLEEIDQLVTPFIGFKLAPDGTDIPRGAAVITPSVIKGYILSWYKQRVPSRFIDYAGFESDLIVQINSSDQNRLDCVIPLRLVRRAKIIAGKLQFHLGQPFDAAA